MRSKLIIASSFIAFIGLASCISSGGDNTELPIPQLNAGTARLTGQIESSEEFSQLKIGLSTLFSSRGKYFDIPIDNNGLFAVEIPLETSVSGAFISSFAGYSDYSHLLLEAGKETKIKIIENEQNEMTIKVVQGLDLDFMHDHYTYKYDTLLGRMLFLLEEHPDYSLPKDSLDRFLLIPRLYASYAIQSDLGARLRIAENDTSISSQSKIMLENVLKLLFAESLFRYPRAMHKISDILKSNGDTTTFISPDPDRNYYTFLKEFDLNNPLYLYEASLLVTLYQTLLKDSILQIPRIEDRSVGEWLTESKAILADLVGFEEGLFYDLLVINAYSRQLNDEMRPLSDRQKKNLTSYYKGGEVEKILLRENEKPERQRAMMYSGGCLKR